MQTEALPSIEAYFALRRPDGKYALASPGLERIRHLRPDSGSPARLVKARGAL